MGQVLYNKYRSKNFSEVIGQDYITSALDNALKNNKIAHAYLFTGPRGVGKTSVARILAYAVNNKTYNDSSNEIDIIEIDAASNNGVEKTRELIERVSIVPVSAKYKVYIIDEVHMLSTASFNALLKTLEEPPSHVIFILATTESHKLPETIISRTQRYNFRPIDIKKLEQHLKLIAQKEKIKISDEAINSIAIHGDGSFRDSISILDQLSNRTTEITLSIVNESLGLASEESIKNIVDYLSSGDSSELLKKLSSLYGSGYNAPIISTQISQYLRKYIFVGNKSVSFDYISLMKELLMVPSSNSPDALLEIVLFNFTRKIDVVDIKPPVITPKSSTPKSEKVHIETIPNEPDPIIKSPKPKATSTVSKSVSEKIVGKTGDIEFNMLIWQDLLNLIKKTNNTVYGILKSSKPKIVNGELEISFSHLFHQKKINEAKNKDIIIENFNELTNHSIEVNCVFVKEDKKVTENKQSTNDKPDISNISNIFDGAEVLESI